MNKGKKRWDWIFFNDAAPLEGEHCLPLWFTSNELGMEKQKSQRENLKVIALFRSLNLQFSGNMYKICSWEILPF